MSIKSYSLQLSGQCPVCDKDFFFADLEVPNNITTNCSHCGALLLIEDGRTWLFNEKLHEEDARWLADGANTGSLTFGEKKP